MKRLSELSKKAIILVIKGYQKTFAMFLGGNCRFIPSCSEYSIQAIQQEGPLKGSLLSMKRICSCHPFGSFGFDPVQKRGE